MADAASYSGDEYTDDEEDGEELDPRVQDELEKLNVAANSINHLEAELDEARAVFRQTITAATYHLQAQIKKVGQKNIDKARPFYDMLREWRKAHFELQRATLQYEKANSRHICARQQVHDAEHKVFSSGEKRAFDTALQEMLNQATIEVNEAENQKKESWLAHQKMYKSFQEVDKKAKEIQSKLKKSVEKTRPYFAQKVGFDRHLWQLKQRVDSIQKGLSEAKFIYSNCLRSLETISDDIHQKRKNRKTMAMIANLQERESGVGADSEDEVSLDQSQLDLDLDCNASLSAVDGMMPDHLPELLTIPVCEGEGTLPSGAQGFVAPGLEGLEDMSLECASTGTLDREVSGAESSDSQGSFTSGALKREVYGCEEGEHDVAECFSVDIQTSDFEQVKKEKNLKTSETSSVSFENLESGNIARERIESSEENLSPRQPNSSSEFHGLRENDGTVDGAQEGDTLKESEECETLKSETNVSVEIPQNQGRTSSSNSESHDVSDKAAAIETEQIEISQPDNNNGDQSESRSISDTAADESLDDGAWS